MNWLCPLCGLKEMPYGTTCPGFKDGSCENSDKLHITGEQYRDQQELSEEKGVGISQISDEA